MNYNIVRPTSAPNTSERAPVRTTIAGTLEKNATQMPAMIVRLTAEPADGGVEELQILEDDGVAEQVLPQRLISKLTLTRVPTCDKPSTIDELVGDTLRSCKQDTDKT